ncbi:LytTR family DNA-binding domain-containing protein [Bifidobacterium samirii]|uniref:LytTR family transcriptional regulator n=1 Tax=Bifidobacterium samirii TaxID=2306974 RepID=A0A430FRA5_9BIFI|nr:LytTR family DNA-binding domain-containing protein [Bifidobacterium samirii]RSX55389.1 LytTR family transcriptional regulator [Bifidobacterium samirii]
MTDAEMTMPGDGAGAVDGAAGGNGSPARDHTVWERLSREVIHRFYTGDVVWLSERLDGDFAGIGAQPEQYRISTQGILFNAIALPDLVFTSERYEWVASCDGLTVVMGQYEAYTAPDQGIVFADTQRFTMVWRGEPAHARLVHWHVSNPLRAAEEGEQFPYRAGAAGLRAVSLMAEQKRYRRELRIQDVAGAIHRLLPFDLRYLSVDGHNTVLHMTDGSTYTVHEGLSSFLAANGLDGPDGGFVRIHRGYVVNALYVRSVSDKVVMTDGMELPLPSRRQSEIREAIAAARRD